MFGDQLGSVAQLGSPRHIFMLVKASHPEATSSEERSLIRNENPYEDRTPKQALFLFENLHIALLPRPE